ncbi:MAG TPA: hypothetical protein VLE91_03565 [Candidatus Saccharimonadales bacterium]|nr:hypothetical protein [Candidatus Saccharimonadales bacterium]
MSDGPIIAEGIKARAAHRKGPGVVRESFEASQHRRKSFLEDRRQNVSKQVVPDTRPFQPQVLTVNEKLAEKNKGKRGGVVLMKQEDDSKRESIGKIKKILTYFGAALILPGILKKPVMGGPQDTGSGSGEVKGGSFGDPLPQAPVVETPPPAPEPKKQEKLVPRSEMLKAAFPFSSMDELEPVIKERFRMLGKKIAPEELEKLRAYESAVAKAAVYVDPENPKTKDLPEMPPAVAALLFGKIIQESQANRMAGYPDSSYKGLVQIGDTMAKDHNMVITNDEKDDRYNIEKSLVVAGIEVRTAYKYWKNWGMAFWEWHDGRGGLQEIIDMYGGPVEGSYREFMQQNSLDAHKLLSDNGDKVYKMVASQTKRDSSQDYLYLIAAAAVAFRDYKQQVPALSSASQKP